MSQHQVKFRKPVDGIHTSHCGRFVATHDENRACPSARWTLVDLELGREVFCASLLRDCKQAAREIVAAPASTHPCVAALQLDDEWMIDLAKRAGSYYDTGDLVAWNPRERRVLSLEPHNTVIARRQARRRAMEARCIDLAQEIERELIETDKPGPRLPENVVVQAVTFREAVRTICHRETEDVSQDDQDEDRRGALVVLPPLEGETSVRQMQRAWREHTMRAKVAPLPSAWVDLIFVDGAVEYGVKVHIRDNDAKRDVWRRCRHAIKEVSSAT